jgi:hypothetical protein
MFLHVEEKRTRHQKLKIIIILLVSNPAFHMHTHTYIRFKILDFIPSLGVEPFYVKFFVSIL